MNYILLIAYDGYAYHGWQIQKKCATITGALQDAFKTAFVSEVNLLGASRTDAGVHALGQVALARTSIELDPKIIQNTWNGRLCRDIHIRSVKIAPQDFHPLCNVIQKTYYYHFFTQRPLPFVARYGSRCRKPIDIERLRQTLKIFVGKHDFRSFYTGDEQESTVRTIDSIDLIYLKEFQTYRIIIKGQGFLRHMIRRIVGACLTIAMDQDRSPNELVDALIACDPHQKLPTADPHGLLLRKIEFNNLNWTD